jgi:hypothetical protein
MDEVAEQQEVAKEISDAISSPFNHSAVDIDETELEKELEELEQEELDRELLAVNVAHQPDMKNVRDEGEEGSSDGKAEREANHSKVSNDSTGKKGNKPGKEAHAFMNSEKGMVWAYISQIIANGTS